MNENWDDKTSVEKGIISYAQLTDQINMQNDPPALNSHHTLLWHASRVN